jgi:hypothetical protein
MEVELRNHGFDAFLPVCFAVAQINKIKMHK